MTQPQTADLQHRVKLLPQKYRIAKIADLTPHPKNPRKGREDIIHDSMKRHGAYGVVLVQKSTGYILGGEHRIKAAIKGGLDKYPIVEMDVDDAEALAIVLDDNHASDLAGYYDEKRYDALEEAFELTTYTEDEFEQIGQQAGRFTEEAGAFLDDDEPDPDDDGGEAELPGFFRFGVTVDADQRAAIREAIAAAKRKWDLRTTPDALVALCRAFTRAGDR